jgi:hypothetical protein
MFYILIMGLLHPWDITLTLFHLLNDRTFAVESFAHDSGRTLARAEYGYPKGSPKATVKEEIHRYSSQSTARLSANPNGLVVNLMELPENRRLRRHLPNDLPAIFLL